MTTLRLQTIFLGSILFILLPPIILFSHSFNTHSLTKIIWLLLTIYITLHSFITAKKIILPPLFTVLFIIFFWSQALSIVGARNIPAYLGRFEDLFFSALFVFLALQFIQTVWVIKKIMGIFFFVFILQSIIQLLFILFPQRGLELAMSIFPSGMIDLIVLNTYRGRLYIESYDEILIPLMIYFFIHTSYKIPSFISLLAVNLLAFFSNFRTRVVLAAFALIASVVFVGKNHFGKFVILLLVIPMLFYSSHIILSRITGFSVVDRLLLTNHREDVEPLTGRLDRWKFAVEIGMSSPVFGVGLGNYYDYLSIYEKKDYSLIGQKYKSTELASFHAHNVLFNTFAETGLFGLLSFSALILYFAFTDWYALQKHFPWESALIIAFWTLFLHSLLNPGVTIKYYTLFWLLRILILRISEKHIMPATSPT